MRHSLLQDVDECAAPAEPCGPGHLCTNSPGSFRCECKAGYYFDGISRTCVGTWASLQAPGGAPENVPVQQPQRADPAMGDPHSGSSPAAVLPGATQAPPIQ